MFSLSHGLIVLVNKNMNAAKTMSGAAQSDTMPAKSPLRAVSLRVMRQSRNKMKV
jgi:hypothetical protein